MSERRGRLTDTTIYTEKNFRAQLFLTVAAWLGI